MGKGNNNNKGKKKQNRDNYFSKNIKTMFKKSVNTYFIFNYILFRYNKRFSFRDIAYSNIDYDKYYQYFTNNQFMSSLIQAANAELFESSSILNSYISYLKLNRFLLKPNRTSGYGFCIN